MSFTDSDVESVFGKRRKCAGCGDDGFRANDSIFSYLDSGSLVELCGKCASSVANAFSIKHSGEPLFGIEHEASVAKSKYKKEKICRQIRKAVFERDKYRCVSCNDHVDLTIDHIKPESKGGSSELDNLQTMCRVCNCKKGVKYGI